MPNFFSNNIDLENKKITLDVETSKHISKVLRYKIGDNVTISDGKMTDYSCSICDITQNAVILNIISSSISNSEFPFEVNLYQGIAKGDKMDNIIQKSTELGITNIIPVETKFTVVKLIGDDKVSKKVDRWNKIALEAAKQSERGIIPEVKRPMKFSKALEDALKDNGIAIICYGREDKYNLKNFFIDNNINKDNKNIKKISFFIGPEGGFDKEEIKIAEDAGIKSVSLGDRILRTETASICMLSMLSYELL